MTRVNALVLILDYADTPLKKTQNTKDSRLFVGPDVLGFFFMMYDDLSLSQNIERINLWREVTALNLTPLFMRAQLRKSVTSVFLNLILIKNALNNFWVMGISIRRKPVLTRGVNVPSMKCKSVTV